MALVGCGTSLFMAQAAASFREAQGLGLTDAFPASELPPTREYDTVIAISRSGTTTEVLDAVRSVALGTRVLAISAATSSPLADLVSDHIPLAFADEQSVVQTALRHDGARPSAVFLGLGRRSGGGTGRRPPRLILARSSRGCAAIRLPRSRRLHRDRFGSGPQAPRSPGCLERGLPDDGVPSRPYLGYRRAFARMGPRRFRARHRRRDRKDRGASFAL